MNSASVDLRLRRSSWLACVVLLTLLFVQPLGRLLGHVTRGDLHSHIPIVPLVTGYLLFMLHPPHATECRSSVVGTLFAGVFGAVALGAAVMLHDRLSLNDTLALKLAAFLGFLTAAAFLFLGARWMAAAAFPMGFLVFMVPLPDVAVQWLERASALTSANTAALLFRLTGTPLLHNGTTLALPAIVLEVAQECSGIRSSWVLFITSVLASHLFLRSGWRRLVLVAFVIPLGIVRNAFRILVIGLLSVHVGPHMLDSAIHRRGGPIFFALSLVPLFLVLWWLRRQEHHSLPLR